MPKKKLTIEFDSKEAAKHFASWLCGSGEQSYWIWMESREEEEKGNITATTFDYWNTQTNEDGTKKYGKFMEDTTIRTVCGRLKK